MVPLIRGGLSILFDHPRLYFNDDSTPGKRMDPFDATQGSLRPYLDRKRRCPVSFAPLLNWAESESFEQ
jgi:hypothetical protein